ncbi:hypothetical protein PVAND_010459 [Polypedilum vanderplanki]|uniref:ATP-dependent DNA helicase PIF1 n=1 Tax=Polypedilum vanderplanki TaxID=319348 RepID=A0A9J6CFL2_POLVA|nr:hypothetical protein PVAND_010459 [Polypedilum vanderplanki]
MEDPVVVSCVTIEWLNAQGLTSKKMVYKTGMIKILRNDIREMFLEVSQDKMQPTKLRLKDINVHKKFMLDGKASINFKSEKCNLYISNAAPASLIFFLKTLYIKLTKENEENKGITKEQMHKKLREHLLSEKAGKFDEISPVTNSELDRARKQAIGKSTLTTPSPNSRKRKLTDAKAGDNPRAPKQLYVPRTIEKRPDDIVQMEVLNEEQNIILQTCLSGKNVFFTGSAGTGKSFLLRKIISTFPPDGLTVCASTGVAACLIGGVTLHSFAGIGAGDHSLKKSIELAKRPAAAQAWRKCKRLIIDEISMVDADFFDLIEAVAREVRGNDKPFGGIQLILCGDFFQLPPVVKRGDNAENQKPRNRFCFQAKKWQSCIQASFELKKIYRQKDPKFVEILNSIRIGRVTKEMTDTLLATARQKIESNGILATQLCSHTQDADNINKSRLENLKTPEKVFESTDSDLYLTKTLDSQLPVPHKLVLKEGCQVMLLKNINLSNGLVNGARGIVTKFSDGFPVVKFKNNVEYIAKPEKWIIKLPNGTQLQRKQVPLKLAYCISIHKSQGLTLDCVEMSLSKVFEAGQAYVALSRAQSLDSLRILDFDGKQIWADPQVLIFYKSFRRQIMDIPVMIPLGGQKKKTDVKKTLNGLKLAKSIMDKPLVTIN